MKRASLRGALALLGLVASGCGPRVLEWNAVSTRESEMLVWEAAARFVITHYDPSEWTGVPAAFCLVVGRREEVARRQQEREAEWTPPATLLRRLGDLDPPVVPIPACRRNEDLQEILVESGAPAVVLGISHPNWESPDHATVWVSTRENSAYGGRWNCRLGRTDDGWFVTDCV